MVARKTSGPLIIETTLCACNGVSGQEAARHLLRALGEQGCQFMDRARRRFDPQPETRIKPTGSILVPVEFQHRFLGRESFAVARGLDIGSAGLSYLAKTGSVVISQNVAREANNLDEVASGQLALARQLYPILQPVYGWIGELGENALDGRFSSSSQLRHVFWVNVLGPLLVEQLDKRFLCACPAHRTDWMDDGGAMIVSTEDYSRWCTSPPKELAEHLGRKIPGIRMYRSAGVELPGSISFHPSAPGE